jgi:hypothetical protein
VAAAANDAVDSSGADLQAIRNDLNNLKDTLSRFMSQASAEAVKTARQVTSNVAGKWVMSRAILPTGAASTVFGQRSGEELRNRARKYGPAQSLGRIKSALIRKAQVHGIGRPALQYESMGSASHGCQIKIFLA